MVRDHSRLSSRRGAVVFVTVILLTVVLGFAALAIDTGLSQVVRGELQRTVDAASLAATQDLRRGGSDWEDLHTAQHAALDFVARNPVLGDRPPVCNAYTDVLLGQAEFNANGRMVNFLPGALPANAVQVSAHFELPYTFAQIFGHSSRTITATASSVLKDRPPVAYWRLGDVVGITAADETGNHDGTYVDDVTLGEIGVVAADTAVRFDGDDQFVEIPHSDRFLLDDGTVSLWFKTDNSATGAKGLFSKDSSGYDTGGHLDIRTEKLGDGQGTKIRARLQSTTTSYNLYSGSIATNNTWHHVVVSFGSGGFKLFLDGAAIESNSYTGGLGTTSGGAGNHEPITLAVSQQRSGNETSAGWDEPFDGVIDEVAIYSRGLTQPEVEWLYQTVVDAIAERGAVVRDSLLCF